eukprot:2874978-Amphidinium_carterae.1
MTIPSCARIHTLQATVRHVRRRVHGGGLVTQSCCDARTSGTIQPSHPSWPVLNGCMFNARFLPHDLPLME